MYDTVFISDVHLGTNRCNVDKFLKFLSNLKTKKLVLVGDILDIHCLEKYNTRWRKKHTQAVEKLIEISKKGIEIVYVFGNHDCVFRKHFKDNISSKFGNISFCDRYVHTTTNNKKFVCIHGDKYSQYSSGSWKQYFMNWGYETITPLNNFLKRTLNISLVNFLKNLPRGKNYINEYETDIANYVINNYKFADGVICGHIHHANLRDFNGFTYICCGDWTDTFSAVVEEKGEFEILRY